MSRHDVIAFEPAVAVAQMARNRGDYALWAGYLLIGCSTTEPDRPKLRTATPCREFVWTPASNAFGGASQRGDYALDDDRTGWFSPARAASLAGLLPAFIGTGGLDLFVDEDIDYARRLGIAGVPVELHVYPGSSPGFDMMATARVARPLREDTDRAIAMMMGVATE